ncbi:MAG: hypothetical protein HYV07_11880 [Deltaproteobacteria bacterium]|nr:hypothetical protein [Deltaproteobacteria bacterium]
MLGALESLRHAPPALGARFTLSLALMQLGCSAQNQRKLPWPDTSGASSIIFAVEGHRSEVWLVDLSRVDVSDALVIEVPDELRDSRIHALLLSCKAEPLLAASTGPCPGLEGACVGLRLAAGGAPLPPPSRLLSLETTAWEASAETPRPLAPVTVPAPLAELRVAVERESLCSRFDSVLVELGPEAHSKPRSASSLPDGSAVVIMPDGRLTHVVGARAEAITATTTDAIAVFARDTDEIYVLEHRGGFWRTDLDGRRELLPSLDLPRPSPRAKLVGSGPLEELEIFAILASPGLARFRGGSWTWIEAPDHAFVGDWVGLVRIGPGEVFAHASGLDGRDGHPAILHVSEVGGVPRLDLEPLGIMAEDTPSTLTWSRSLGVVAATSSGRLLAWQADRFGPLNDLDPHTRTFVIEESNEGVIHGGKFKTLHELGTWSGACANVHVATDDVHELVRFAGGYLAVMRDIRGRPVTAEIMVRAPRRSVCGLPLAPTLD